MLQETHFRTRSPVTKYHRLGLLTSRYWFLQVQRLGDQGASNQQIQFLVRALFLACRQPSSCSVFSWSVCENGEGGKAGVEREKENRKRKEENEHIPLLLVKVLVSLEGPIVRTYLLQTELPPRFPSPDSIRSEGEPQHMDWVRGTIADVCPCMWILLQDSFRGMKCSVKSSSVFMGKGS